MKHRLIVGILLLITAVLIFLIFSGENEKDANGFGKLRVEGIHLVDENGITVQLKGISTHGLAWFPDYVNKDAFRWLKEQGNVNVIRLSMYTSEWGGYCVSSGNQKELKVLIDQGIQDATKLGMYVIVDWHMLGADEQDREDCNPLHYLEESKKFFGELSQKYKDYNNIIYEICNEPNNGEFGEEFQVTWADVKQYADEIIPIIRKNTDNIIVVGTPNWSSDVSSPAMELGTKNSLSTKYTNIMYTFHFYAASHKEYERGKVEEAVKAGLPIFVTEYDSCDASGDGKIDKTSMRQWMELLNRYQISCVKWNLSNKDETSAFLKKSCNKLNHWDKEDLSPSGQLMIKLYQN
ncbi:MAG: glycoside hydrolase family 5 protein [Eubacterium sp.]|nr:glycoside hydrolase family 5 protein [Eubacterium sp.]